MNSTPQTKEKVSVSGLNGIMPVLKCCPSGFINLYVTCVSVCEASVRECFDWTHGLRLSRDTSTSTASF